MTDPLALYRTMLTIREAQLALPHLFAESEVPGSINFSVCQEGSVISVGAALGPEDSVASTHRETPPSVEARSTPSSPRSWVRPAASAAGAGVRCMSRTSRGGCWAPTASSARARRPRWRFVAALQAAASADVVGRFGAVPGTG